MLEITRYRLDFDHRGAMAARFLGSAWRGVLGHQLRGNLCSRPGEECGRCSCSGACSYHYLFETVVSTDGTLLRQGVEAPRPFIVLPLDTAPPGKYSLLLTLFGRARQVAPQVVRALAQGGKAGLDGIAEPFLLTNVLQESVAGSNCWNECLGVDDGTADPKKLLPLPPAAPQILRIVLQTQLRLRVDGDYVGPESFRFVYMFSHLLRRISLLCQYHMGRLIDADFAELVRCAKQHEAFDVSLRWTDWTRYSNRQSVRVPMGGLTGEFKLKGDGIAPLWPYLWYGQFTHVGKGACMGLGLYSLRERSA